MRAVAVAAAIAAVLCARPRSLRAFGRCRPAATRCVKLLVRVCGAQAEEDGAWSVQDECTRGMQDVYVRILHCA